VAAYNMVTVDNNLMHKWRIKDAEELYAIASENTQRIFPGSIRPVDEILRLSGGGRGEGTKELAEAYSYARAGVGGCPLYVATNTEMLNGAGVVLYNGLLRSFADSAGKNLYLLPSSAHEMAIALEGKEEGEVQKLREIVQGANQSLAAGKEALSSNIYYYDRSTDSVGIV